MKHKIRLPETPKVPIHKNIIPSFFNMLAPFSMMLLFLFLYFSFFKLKTKPNTPNNIIPIGIAIGTTISIKFISLLFIKLYGLSGLTQSVIFYIDTLFHSISFTFYFIIHKTQISHLQIRFEFHLTCTQLLFFIICLLNLSLLFHLLPHHHTALVLNNRYSHTQLLYLFQQSDKNSPLFISQL